MLIHIHNRFFVCARRCLNEMYTQGKEACDAALHRMKMENVKPGDELPKVEHAKDSDRFLVSRVVTVPLPSFQYGEEVYAGINCRMKWAISSKDCEVELTERNLRYWLAALAASPQLPKKEKKAKNQDQDQKEDENEGPQDEYYQADPDGNSQGENAGKDQNEHDGNTAGDQNGVNEGEHDEEEKAVASPKKRRKLKRRRSDVEGGSPPKKDRKP